MNIIKKYLIFPLFFVCFFNSAMAGEWIIAFDSLGPIKIGMTTAQVLKAKGNLVPSTDGDKLDINVKHCIGVYFPEQFLYLQLEAGKLEEIQITSPKYKAIGGIGVGNTFADIQKAFDRKSLTIGTNHYNDDVPQVTIEASEQIKLLHPGARIGIQVEFEAGPLTGTSRISSISIGAHYVEGCA